jgi:RimJ/RimL family protein N-acetyltransferase
MLPGVVDTRRLRLVPKTRDTVLAEVAAMPSDDRSQLSAAWLEQIAQPDAGVWTLGFAVVDRASEEVVGGCGCKGPPDGDGVVEIAYGIAPAHQRRGYGTEAAAALTEWAFGTPHVRVVRAHTVFGNVGSIAVLRNCGFHLVGEVVDPDDGPVYRWERIRRAAGSPGVLSLPLATDRLVLRDVVMEDTPAIHAYASDPAVTAYMFYGPREEPDTRAYVSAVVASQTDTPRRRWELAVEDRSTGLVIGGCDLTMTNSRESDLGYVLSSQAWGRGYATELAKALVHAGFAQLGLERIFATCELTHTRSQRVLEKAGLERVRRLSRTTYAKGRWWDMWLYELHRGRWERRRH